MGIIDAFILIIFSYYIAKGLGSGLAKQILRFAASFLALIAALLLFRVFARLLEHTSLFCYFESKTSAFLVSNSRFMAPLSSTDASGQINAALKDAGLPGFLASLITSGAQGKTGVTLAALLSPVFARILICIFSFLFLFIVFLFTGKTIVRYFDDILSVGVLGIVNALGGAGLSIIKAFILISALMMFLSLLGSLSTVFNEFLIRDLRLDNEVFRIGKYFYYNNPVIVVFQRLFG